MKVQSFLIYWETDDLASLIQKTFLKLEEVEDYLSSPGVWCDLPQDEWYSKQWIKGAALHLEKALLACRFLW